MKAPFVKSAVAVAVAAGLGWYVFQVEMKRDPEADKKKEKVVTLDKAKAKTVEIARRDGEVVRAEKATEGWRVVAPGAFAADGNEVEGLLRSLESLEIDEVLENPGAPADFGLEPAARTVSVTVEGAAAPLAVSFGDKTPDGTQMYAKLPSQPRIFTVAASAERSFDKKAFDLRDRDLLHVKRDAIRSLDVTGPEGAWALASGGENAEWVVTKPLRTRAGRWQVDGVLGLVEGLRMESVAAEEATDKDLATWGLAKPVRTVTLTLADGGTKTLAIGGFAGEKKFYARDASARLVAVIPTALVDDLAKGLDSLRQKRLLDVSVYDVMSFDVESGGTKRVWTRTDEKDAEGVDVPKWKRTAPDAKDYEAKKIQDALFLIGGVEVAEFVDKPGAPDAYGLAPPALRCTMRFKQGKPEQSFELGMKDGTWYARRPDDDSVLKLDPAKAAELSKAFTEL